MAKIPTPTQLHDALHARIRELLALRERASLLPTAKPIVDLIGKAIIALDDAADQLSATDHMGNA